ncbi:DUF6351 family protein [Salsipaludibacter albus]|uniref:DUF6351 family protein n=1 Tax=Salsipaludibacter albus TaxID=2849650 RepID=UPI001EE4B76F|nr:DUF6351 family protein [Salsipaludibacter albus]MBY5164054.1 hypothetical protein [Salsipaludibacter albus]
MDRTTNVTTRPWLRPLVLLALLALALPLATPSSAAAPPAARGGWSIEVLSSPPDQVSGGDARLAIELPPGQVGKVAVLVGDRDQTDAFVPTGAGRLEGVVDGLDLGPNTVSVVRANNSRVAMSQTVLTNHPITGPMFSGPQQQPFLCSTPGDYGNAELAGPVDDDCSMDTVVSHKYRTTDGRFVDYDPDAPRPDDMATTTTIDGTTVDYVVRWERGTINRFIYSIAVLSPGGASNDPETAPDLSAWNGRLIYRFQGGVGIGHYQGDPSRSRMLEDQALSRGYAIAYSTGTKAGEHYNLVVGGETAIMVKDRFVTHYADPDYTVGLGASGGAIQQYVYGQNHPGLIDAAIPVYSYPDMITQTIHVGDCELLERWIDLQVVSGSAKWADWTNRTLLEGMNAINGFDNDYLAVMPPGFPAGSSECINGWRGLSPLVLNPNFGTAPGITPAQQAATEWTHFGDAINVYGLADDGFARRTWDNVGVQYGLESLVAGDLTVAEFLDVNARAGSWKNEPDMVQEGCPFIQPACPDPADLAGLGFGEIWPDLVDPWSWRNMALSPDGGATPAPRASADPGAVEAAHEAGLVFRGELEIPVIDWRNYLERELDMHNSHQSFASRQRLLDHDGDAGNQVIWFTDGNDDGDEYDQTGLALEVMDDWMAAIVANPRRSVADNRPPAAVDSCFDASGTLLAAGEDAWAGILDDAPAGPCTEAFPLYSTSRIRAGGPITGDVFQCDLQPVADAVQAGVYGDVVLDAAAVARLEAIFPTGVCDW